MHPAFVDQVRRLPCLPYSNGLNGDDIILLLMKYSSVGGLCLGVTVLADLLVCTQNQVSHCQARVGIHTLQSNRQMAQHSALRQIQSDDKHLEAGYGHTSLPFRAVVSHKHNSCF